MSKKERKISTENSIIEEYIQELQQNEKRQKEILASPEYIEQLFGYFEKHDCVNKSVSLENETSIIKDLSLFFEIVDAYAKKNMLKNYADSDFVDKIYYISYSGIVACIMHKDIHYGGEVSIKRCNPIPHDVEIVPFADIMAGKVSSFLLERVEAKEQFEKDFGNFLRDVAKTGISLEEAIEYVNELIGEKQWDNLRDNLR